MRKAKRLLPFVLMTGAGILLAVSLSGEAIPIDLAFGYRWVDVSGNEQMYRTQINDRPGFLLRSLNYTSEGPVGNFFDYLHVDGSDIGAGPAGQLRMQAGQVDLFKLTFTWREMDAYSALPAFANPFLAEGIIPGQQTYNRTRNIYDALLELFPGKALTPLLGYTRNTYDGPGTTTYHLGGNEFLLNQQVNSVDELYRIGLGFHYGNFQGAVTQGWRQFRWKETDTLAPGAGDGNVSTPVLGQEITADVIDVGAAEQDQHARDERLAHREPPRPPQADWKLHPRRREQRHELRRGRRRELRVFRDCPVLLRVGRDGELAGPDRLLAGIGPRRGSAGAQRGFRRRVVGAGPHARRAGAHREPLPEHGDLRRPERRQPAPADRRPDGPREAGPGLRRDRHGAHARLLCGQRRLVAAPPEGHREPRCLGDRRARRSGGNVRTDGQHVRGRRVVLPDPASP